MNIASNHGIIRIKAVDQNNRTAEYYIRLNNIKKLLLNGAMTQGRKNINLSSYGDIIYSAYIENAGE